MNPPKWMIEAVQEINLVQLSWDHVLKGPDGQTNPVMTKEEQLAILTRHYAAAFVVELMSLFVEPVIGAINGNVVNDRIRQAYALGKKDAGTVRECTDPCCPCRDGDVCNYD